jgi:predicted PurR-regulated permease PerM
MFTTRQVLYTVGLALLALGVWYFSDIVTYLLVAWVLSMLGRPLMVFFQRRIRFKSWRMGPDGAAVLTIVTFCLIVVGLLMMFVPTIVSQARNLANADYAAMGEKLRGPFAWLDQQVHQLGMLQPGESLATKTQQALIQWFRPALVGDFVGSFISTAGNTVVFIVTVLFILFFFLRENSLFLEIIHAVVPTHLESKVRHAVDESSDVLNRYFRGLLLQTGAFATMVSVFLWILGVPNAMLIGAFGGLLNVVPYVGPIIGLLFGCFITFSSHPDMEFALMWPQLAKVVGTFMVVQVIDNLFVSTIIFSKSVQAHPLEIFLITIMAAKVGGVAGMVLGIPVYTVMRVIARTFFSEFKVVQRLTDHLDDEDD